MMQPSESITPHITVLIESSIQVIVTAFFTLTAYLYRIKAGEDKFSFLGFILVMMVGVSIGYLVDWTVSTLYDKIDIHMRLLIMGVSGISSYQIFDIIMKKAGIYILGTVFKFPVAPATPPPVINITNRSSAPNDDINVSIPPQQ